MLRFFRRRRRTRAVHGPVYPGQVYRIAETAPEFLRADQVGYVLKVRQADEDGRVIDEKLAKLKRDRKKKRDQ